MEPWINVKLMSVVHVCVTCLTGLLLVGPHLQVFSLTKLYDWQQEGGTAAQCR